MKFAVIGKNIRDSKVPSLLKGMYEKIGKDIKCEFIELNCLVDNLKYLEKMDGFIIYNTFNEEIVNYINTNEQFVNIVRKKDDELVGYDTREFIALKGENRGQAFNDYYLALSAFRIFFGLLDFESNKAKEVYNKLVEEKITDKRFNHILSVCKLAKEINKYNNLGESIEKIEVAALLHDVTKEVLLTEEQVKELHAEHLPKQVWHALSGVVVAREEYNINDEDILNAIRFHTTGRKNMSVLEEIINIADFAEELREEPICIEAREVAYTNYKKGLALKYNRLQELRKDNLTQDNIDAYEKYKRYLDV